LSPFSSFWRLVLRARKSRSAIRRSVANGAVWRWGSKLTDKEQSERFELAARELGADETGAPFERAIETILSDRGKNPRSDPSKPLKYMH
jgi:hypothetical protein